MKQFSLISVLCALLLSISAHAQENQSLDNQLRENLQKNYINLNVLIQSEGRYSFQNDDFQGGRSFSVPNARISIKGNLDGGFFYRVFVDAAPKPVLLDAYVGYTTLPVVSGGLKKQ